MLLFFFILDLSLFFSFMKGLFHYITLPCLIPPSTCLSSSMALSVSIPFLTAFDFLGIKIPVNTVQGSSPHKCGQESSCAAFNAVVAAFSPDISVSLSLPYALVIYLYLQSFLEGGLKGKPRSFSPADVMSEEGTPLGPTSLDVCALFF